MLPHPELRERQAPEQPDPMAQGPEITLEEQPPMVRILMAEQAPTGQMVMAQMPATARRPMEEQRAVHMEAGIPAEPMTAVTAQGPDTKTVHPAGSEIRDRRIITANIVKTAFNSGVIHGMMNLI